ncbi:MAG: NADP-dependent oxidoreductase, partial [Brachybacterium sp.]|nr:NADP-dependent oxidoreductase [Brachybacterium sp.]MDN5901387.1 NADP-dependent oxidoreductase [Brachybacterium sp.]
MKAYLLTAPDSETITLTDVPVPEPGPGELLVRLEAIGVGIHDSYFLPPDAAGSLPIGIEGAGVVEEVGSEVTDHRRGDRIAFVNVMQPKGGTWAEFAVVDVNSLILPIPEGLDMAQAAALPVAGNTVLRALAAISDMPAGGTLFIAGGAGAIGTLALQVARRRGWRVAASASAHNHEYMRSLGAEMTVDYHDAGWVQEVRGWAPQGVDAALAVHPGTSADSMRVVKDGGSVITVSGDSVPTERGITPVMIDYAADVRAELLAMTEDVATGAVHLEIERVHPFAEAAEALDRVRTRHVRGKLVLRL